MLCIPPMGTNYELNPTQDKPSFEMALERLQLAVKRLESGELNLEDSLKIFEEGVKLTQVCQNFLSAAEQRVEILMKSSQGLEAELQPFNNNRNEVK